MRKSIFLTIAVICGVTGTLQAQNVKKYPSLLWEITGNGLTQPSYLYGTMHVSERVAYHLSDTFFIALKKCDVVALESDPTTWLQEMLQEEDMVSGMRMYMREQQRFFEKTFVVDEFEKEDIRGMLSADPSIVNGMMYRMSMGRANYEEDTYLDMFIFQAGNKLGKKVTHLEDYKKSREMVEKAYKRDKDEKYSYDDYDYEEDILKGKDLFELIEDAYRRGDLDMLDSLSNLRNPTKNFRKWMLDERNKVMVRGMDSIMKNQTLFTAVGAAHLPGKMGVIELLREKGYTVRPVKYTATKNAIKTKEKIEKMRLPISFTPQSVAQGTISFQAPGKMFEMPQFKSDARIYLGLEMVNGSYHLITRLRSRILLENKSPDYFSKQLDSMLFENLPGKILFKKHSVSPEGYPVIETAVKSRAADVMRYKIFVTPFEVIVFSLGGRGEMALEKESSKFFENIKFQLQKKEWSEFSGSGFKVKLPGMQLDYSDVTTMHSNASVDAFDPADSTYYIVMNGFYNDLDFVEDDTFELGYLTRNFYKEKEDITVVEKKYGQHQNYPTLITTLKDKKGKCTHLKFYIHKDRYYMQASFGSKSTAHPEFFESFEITNTKDTCQYKKYEDTLCFFSANMPSRIEVSGGNPYGNYYYDYDYYDYYDEEGEEEIDRSHEGEQHEMTFTHPVTGESATVKYERYPRYSSEDFDTLVKYEQYMDWDERMLKKSGLKITKKENQRIIDYYLKDTASVRVIKARVIYNNGTCYQLKFYTDTVSAPTQFESEFFSTFQPDDTIIGKDIFADKRELFFADLAGDSTHHAQAMASLSMVYDFEDEDAPKIINELNNSFKNKTSLDDRAFLINRLSYLRHKDILPYLMSQYDQVGDTSILQNGILGGLLAQSTKEGHAAFLKAIMNNTPLTENDYDISGFFWQAYDSIELAPALYPKLFELTQYDEYKWPVYSLFLAQVDSNLLKKEMLTEKKNAILRDANEDLKRIMSNKSADEEGMDYDYEDYSSGFDASKLTPQMRQRMEEELAKMGMTMEEAMSYGGSRHEYDGYGGESNPDFELNCELLTLFNDDLQVKTFFEKIEKSKNRELILDTRLLFLRREIPVADSVWKNYSADPQVRTLIYRILKEEKKEQLFDTTYYSQREFVESEIIQNERLDMKKDSLVFIEKRWVKNDSDTGFVYIYKIKQEGAENWNLYFCGYQPEDSKKVELYPSLLQRSWNYSRKEKKIEENINDFIDDLNNKHHQRISTGDDYYGDYYYDY